MQANNQPRLFMASCISLLLTAMTFAIRARLETVFGPAGVGLTLEQIGYAFMPAFCDASQKRGIPYSPLWSVSAIAGISHLTACFTNSSGVGTPSSK